MSRRELAKPNRRAKRSISLRERAYDAAKRLIITCALKPGEYVNELQLSEMLKIGRTPVHEALNRLMLEGLVEIIPRKGVIVKPISLNDVLHVIEVRLINECYCARLAADRASDQDIADLRNILERAPQWIAKRDVENLMLIDHEFHLTIARAARNDVVTDFVRSLHERSLRFWFVSLHEPGQHQVVHKQHQDVFDAIRNRDPDLAEAAMRRHIEAFRTNICRFF